jgi:von Willebrand factor type A domain
MGLCYRTSIWLDRLWSEHLSLSQPARDLVKTGVQKQGDPFAGFPADLHARLYLPTDPPAIDTAPEWASHLHDLAAELGEWARLRLMCSRNGFAAAIATEAALEQLLPHVPDHPPTPPSEPATDPQGGRNPEEQSGQGSSPKSPQTGAQDPRARSPEPTLAQGSDAQIRAGLRKAIRAARDAVQDAEAGLEGMSTSLGLSLPGTSTVLSTGPANLKAVREAHTHLQSSHRLKRISELAGRLERVAAAKARSKVKPGVGEIHGIGLGGLPDLARLLPSELVALRRRRLRLAFLARLLQQKALCYAMTGREPQARGPIVILLDESSSMREAAKDIWSKAVALALLSTATKQRRAWHLVAFNAAITREVTIRAGKATINDVQRAIDRGCSGGTNFDPVVLRAVEVIRMSPTMKQADCVVITDGESDLEATTIEAATKLTRTEGVSWFCVGVGPDAELGLQSLAPISTSMVRVRQTDDANDLVAPVINLENDR